MQHRLSNTIAIAIVLFGIAGWMNAGEASKDSGIVGSWSATRGTSTVKLELTKDSKFTLTKSRDEKSETFSGTYKTDAKAKPQSIDMTVTGGTAAEAEKFKGKVSLGIVKADGSKLEWCANEPGKSVRPKIFAGKDGDDSFLHITFERAK